MFLPTSSKRSRVSIIIFLGDNFFPVIFAGQDDVHLPHSVQEYASINCFHDKSETSFAPKREGVSPAGGGVNEGSRIAFTSLVTEAKFVNSPLGSRFEYQ